MALTFDRTCRAFFDRGEPGVSIVTTAAMFRYHIRNPRLIPSDDELHELRSVLLHSICGMERSLENISVDVRSQTVDFPGSDGGFIQRMWP
ncbi:hypothetical protein TNCV_2897931 [Trichonephila clavipes]|nr:hypothetical protein TNCV_2897931 [Trichonephila clavipes]